MKRKHDDSSKRHTKHCVNNSINFNDDNDNNNNNEHLSIPYSFVCSGSTNVNIATNENANHRDRDTTTDRDLRKDQRTSPQKAATTKGETTRVLPLPLHYYY